MLYLCGNPLFVDAAHHTQRVHHTQHVHYALCHVHYALCHVHHALCHVHCTVQLVDTLIVLVVGRAEYQRFRSAEKVCIGLGVQGVLICTSNGGYLQAVADISGR